MSCTRLVTAELCACKAWRLLFAMRGALAMVSGFVSVMIVPKRSSRDELIGAVDVGDDGGGAAGGGFQQGGGEPLGA